LVIFCLMGVSRRAFAIPLLLMYFAFVLENRKVYLLPAILFLLVFVPVVMHGKEALAYIGATGDFNLEDFDIAVTASSGMARVAADVGQSVVESWATVLYLDDLPLRFGVDHVLSLMRRFPEGMLGLDIDF